MSYYNAERDNAGFQKQNWLVEMLGRTELTVFDVGGNIGQSVEKYRELFPACNVYSFEPHPRTFSALQERYSAVSGVHCEQLALGARPGTASFYATKCAEASSLFAPEEFIRERSPKRNYDYAVLKVSVDTLDHVTERLGIETLDILKIDVQGAELEVLRGAEKLLREGRIDIIYSEVLFAENYSGQSDFCDIWFHLKQFGYAAWDLFPFLHTKLGRLWTANAIFVSHDTLIRIDPQ